MARQAPTSRSRTLAIAGVVALLGLAAVPILGGGGDSPADALPGSTEARTGRPTSHAESRATSASTSRRPDPPRIEGVVLKTTWPVTPNQDAGSIAKGLTVLATSYVSDLPEVLSMEASLQFILASGELYQGGFVSVSLASMRANPMYAETVEDNIAMQVHQLLEQKAAFEAAR